MFKKKKFPVSAGNQLRDFCYIDDVVRAIMLSLNNKKIYGEIINIGSGKPVLIKKIINTVVSKVGSGRPCFGKIKYRNLENLNLYANISKAKKLLK